MFTSFPPCQPEKCTFPRSCSNKQTESHLNLYYFQYWLICLLETPIDQVGTFFHLCQSTAPRSLAAMWLNCWVNCWGSQAQLQVMIVLEGKKERCYISDGKSGPSLLGNQIYSLILVAGIHDGWLMLAECVKRPKKGP